GAPHSKVMMPTPDLADRPTTAAEPGRFHNLQFAICNLQFAIPGLLLTLLCLFLFFHHLAARDLWSSHEGRAAQDAQSILDDGSWGLPRLFDHKVELQKPPLYYWLVAAVARLL